MLKKGLEAQLSQTSLWDEKTGSGFELAVRGLLASD